MNDFCIDYRLIADERLRLGPQPQQWQKRKLEQEQSIAQSRMNKPNFKLGGWICDSCERINVINVTMCRRCSRRKPPYIKEGTGSWQCVYCYLHQHPSSKECMSCVKMEAFQSNFNSAQEKFDCLMRNQDEVRILLPPLPSNPQTN